MAHRGEAPARTSPDAAASARRSAAQDDAESASMRFLLELQLRHRSMLQALVSQQAEASRTLPASSVQPVGPGATLPGVGTLETPLSTRAFPATGASSSRPGVDPKPAKHFAVFRSRNVSVPISEYDAQTHGPTHVARELDVDAEGRTLVGVESGPHKELRVALDRLCSAPRYGALGMADELILLTADARVFRDDAMAAKSPDGALRFLILNESYHRAVAAHGSWVVDGDVVENVIADVVDEAAKARSAPEAERKALLAGFAGRGQKRPREAGGRAREATPSPTPRRPAARKTSEERETKPILESRPAPDVPENAERKSASGRAREAPLPSAVTASSGSESSEGSESSASGTDDSETAGSREGVRPSLSLRRREAVQRAVAAAQRERLKKKAAASASPSTTTKEVDDAEGADAIEDVIVIDDAANGDDDAANGDANEDSDDYSDDMPFLDVDIVAPGGSAPLALDADAAASRRKREPPRLEEFHAIRGLVLGSVANSLISPRKKPPPTSSVQFQLATSENQFHVLAARCDARSEEEDFDVRVTDGGLVYVDKKAGRNGGSTDAFEFVARFPEPVDETSAQSVVKDGVLFVVCEPKRSAGAR